MKRTATTKISFWRVPASAPMNAGNEDAGDEQKHGRRHGRLPRGEEHREEAAGTAAGEVGNGQEHRDDREVLEDEDAQERPTVRRVQLPPVHEQLQDDRRRRQGDEVAEEERMRGAIAAGGRDSEDERDRDRHLDRPTEPYELAQASEVAERKLEPDGEEQEDDSQVGEHLDDVDVAHESEAERTEETAGHEEPDQRRLADAVEHVRGAERREEDQGEGPEKLRGLHRGSLCASGGSLVASPPFAHEFVIRRRRPRRAVVVRPSARTLDAVLHRDVGTVQLLRHAGAPDPLPGGVGAERRIRTDRPEGRGDLRALHRRRLSHGAAGRMDRGPDLRPAARRFHRRLRDRRGALQHGRPVGPDLLSRPLPDRPRNGAAQAQRQRDGGRPVPRRRRPPRLRLLPVLHGHQHRGLRRALHLRLSRRAGQLAHGLRRRRRGHGPRSDPVPAGGALSRDGRVAAAAGRRIRSRVRKPSAAF